MRDDVLAFPTCLGIGRVDIVGHSLGGAVAHLRAQHAPEVVRRLVLEDVPAPLSLDPPRPPTERPDGALPFDWAMVRATDAQRNAPPSRVVGSHGADHHAHAPHRGRADRSDTAGPGHGARRAAVRRTPGDHRRRASGARGRPEEFLAVVEAFLEERDLTSRTPS
ncbi:alpha/beta fold hydrolase [Streptomyces sp. NPDC006602]|uniref:alpha/beta fold hydrolase n=1 Tax=Streptomyces sp. NPDC006602 TaxID=3364751 RepID=UPI0036AB55B0